MLDHLIRFETVDDLTELMGHLNHYFQALTEHLAKGPIVVELREYGEGNMTFAVQPSLVGLVPTT